MPARTGEQFLNSAQQEHRELLVDGRATPIEWNIAGSPAFILMTGVNGGGDYLLSLRSLWTYDRFGQNAAIYFLLQWPDPSQSVLEQPIVNDSIDVFDDNGNQIYNCPADDRLIRPTSWHRATNVHEDQVVIELFSDSLGSYPADNWRWGAGTTDPVFPTSGVEFVGATEDSIGSTVHPAAGFMEDRYDIGGGPVDADPDGDPVTAQECDHRVGEQDAVGLHAYRDGASGRHRPPGPEPGVPPRHPAQGGLGPALRGPPLLRHRRGPGPLGGGRVGRHARGSGRHRL